MPREIWLCFSLLPFFGPCRLADGRFQSGGFQGVAHIGPAPPLLSFGETPGGPVSLSLRGIRRFPSCRLKKSMELNLGVFKTKVNQKTAFLVHNFPNWVYYVSGGPKKFWGRSIDPQFSQRLRPGKGHDAKTCQSTVGLGEKCADTVRGRMKYEKCPKCGGDVLREKHTGTGRQVREYDCFRCGWSETVDEGPALWTIMSEAAEDDEPEQEAGAD